MAAGTREVALVTVAGLVFDMDGVVVDSVGYWNEVRETLLAERLGVTDVDVSTLVGMNAGDEYDYLARSHELDCSREAYVRAVHDRAETIYTDRVELLPGLADCLATARRRSIPVGLVSAAARRRVDLVLDRFDLADRFAVVRGGDEVPGPSKPDPSIYTAAIEALGCSPAQVVAVEDSRHGVAAATGAGAYCIGYDHHPDQPLDDADERIERPARLVERVQQLLRDGSTLE